VKIPRLAYAGNRKIGVEGLRLLLARGLTPVALLVADEAAFGEAPGQMEALLPGVPTLRGRAFREEAGARLLADLELDYLLSVHFPYRVPGPILALPRIGPLNLHPAWLPYNRGWHTPSWAIYEGTPYGASLHWMSEEVDAGDLALCRRVEVRPDDTADRLYQRVLTAELGLLAEAIPRLILGTLPREPQTGPGTVHRRQDLAAIQRLDLDQTRTVGETLTHLRALTTSRVDEAAWFEAAGRRYAVRVEIVELDRDAEE